jgi:hypothetical protein
MVLFQKMCLAVRSFDQDGLHSRTSCLYSSNFGTFWLKIEQFWPFEEISIFIHGDHLGYRTGLIRKKGDEIKKKSSPLKLLSQSQPSFAEMILGWSSSKIVFGIPNRQTHFLEENHPMTISSKFYSY